MDEHKTIFGNQKGRAVFKSDDSNSIRLFDTDLRLYDDNDGSKALTSKKDVVVAPPMSKGNIIKGKLSNMISFLDKRNRTKFPVIERMSAEINDAYSKIDTILKSNVENRAMYGRKQVSGSYKDFSMYIPSQKKRYQLNYVVIGFNLDEIVKIIRQYGKDNNTSDLLLFRKEIDDAMYNHYWYLLEVELVLRTTAAVKAPLDLHVDATKNNADVIYQLAYNEDVSIDNSLAYAQLMRKVYNEFEGEFGSNKPVMDEIDKIYNILIKYLNLSIIFNTLIRNGCVHIMQHYSKQLESFYEQVSK